MEKKILFMNNLKEITELIRSLPGMSLKFSERLAINLIENKDEYIPIMNNIILLSNNLVKDDLTGLIIVKGEEPNANKEKDILLVVDSNKDISNIIEKTKTNKSSFVLGMKNKRDFDNINKSLDRLFFLIKRYNTKEILFLLTPSIESELVMRVTKEELEKSDIQNKPIITRLSMGIPFGGSIEFSDERTIKEAVSKREKA